MKNTFFLLFILLATIAIQAIDVNAQQVYSTNKGVMQIQGIVASEEATFYSNNLIMVLDYNTSDLQFTISNENIAMSEKELNLGLKEGTKIQFNGNLGLGYINTESHPKLAIQSDGTLKVNNQTVKVNFSGNLEHLYAGTQTACMLNLFFKLTQDEIDLLIPDNPFEEGAIIKIVYTLLDYKYHKNSLN